jgi:hypothetical protein
MAQVGFALYEAYRGGASADVGAETHRGGATLPAVV